MSQQITFEDKRQSPKKTTPVPFSELPQDCLFTTDGNPNLIRLKNTQSNVFITIYPNGEMWVTIVSDPKSWANCTPRPDLRVRIVVEDA